MISDCCLAIITIVFPPLGVFLAYGCGGHLCLNFILTLMGYLPGIIHGLYCIMKRPRRAQYTSGYQQGPYQPGPPPPGQYHQGPPGHFQQGPPQFQQGPPPHGGPQHHRRT